VLVFDYRGRGDSEAASADAGRLDLDVEGAVDELVRRDARRVFLFGTYAGGAISVVAATSTPERIAGVIAVSPAAGKGQYVDGPYSASGAFEVAGRLRVPVLYITVRTDEYVPIGEARRLYRLTGSPVKRLEVIPAGGGGWTLFNVSPYAPRANRAVLEFLNRMAR
jgi:pimeloyl-ACP methyl ester carboxylesterase